MPATLDLNIAHDVLLAVMRYAAPILSLLILLRCGIPLLFFRKEPEVWGWLIMSDGKRLPLQHWENVVGRNRRCDIVLDLPTVSRNHCVLTRYDDGSWTISDAGSKGGILVNDRPAAIHELRMADKVTIGGLELTFEPISPQQAKVLFGRRPRATGPAGNLLNLMLLSVFQALSCLSFLLGGGDEKLPYFLAFGGVAIIQWSLFLIYLFIRKSSFEVETIAFFLCTMCMAAVCTVCPGEVVKQLIAIVLGVITFLVVGWSLRNLERAKVIRYLAAVGGVALLAVTLIFGKEINGAKNWLIFGNYSFQPSELAKICFVYIGASTMDRLMNKRNIVLFISYTVMLCGFLALMNDFGTALIFFFAFLLIAYMRSGSVGTIALACTALGFAGMIGVKIAPHALRRFATWRHIWEDPFGAGYQQTRALICIASGGLLGIGIGQGKMKHIYAADSDMVFATLSEEWGLIMALMCVISIVILALFAMRCAPVSRSSMYAIASCTAAGILLVQTIFNALGTVDILPLTGVNFPFVSNGGSGMMGVWGLLAFIKAGDTRRNASFATNPIRFRRDEDE
jgi:cell division protein FtsW (lipid II flippase)